MRVLDAERVRLNGGSLRQSPEIVAVEKLNADFAPAFRVVAAVHHSRLNAPRSIALRKHERSACFHRMAAHERRAMQTYRNRPGFFFPGASGIFAAENYRNG